MRESVENKVMYNIYVIDYKKINYTRFHYLEMNYFPHHHNHILQFNNFRTTFLSCLFNGTELNDFKSFFLRWL